MARERAFEGGDPGAGTGHDGHGDDRATLDRRKRGRHAVASGGGAHAGCMNEALKVALMRTSFGEMARAMVTAVVAALPTLDSQSLSRYSLQILSSRSAKVTASCLTSQRYGSG